VKVYHQPIMEAINDKDRATNTETGVQCYLTMMRSETASRP